MNDKGIIDLHPRNPTTQAVHRHEVFWQITVPVIIGVVILVALAVLVGISGAAEVSQLADVALIWMVAPALILTLIVILIMAGITFLVFRIVQLTPYYSYRIQEFLLTVRMRAEQLSDAAAKPVTFTNGISAGFREFTSRLRGQRPPVR